jgi:hypothetical protein
MPIAALPVETAFHRIDLKDNAAAIPGNKAPDRHRRVHSDYIVYLKILYEYIDEVVGLFRCGKYNKADDQEEEDVPNIDQQPPE